MKQPTISATLNFDALTGSEEKHFDALYNKIVEVTSVLIAKHAGGYFQIITNLDIAEWMAKSQGYKNYHWNNTMPDLIPMGTTKIFSFGILNNRWHIIVNPAIEEPILYIGTKKEYSPFMTMPFAEFKEHVASLTISNFVK